MSYIREIISDGSTINNIITEHGYLTDGVYKVVSKIIELCVSIIIIEEVINKYVAEENIPQRVEINVNIPVISLSHDKSVDPCESLESIGCIANIDGSKYRVMIHRLMSRIFSLTNGTESITNMLESMNSPEIFIDVVNKIELEFVDIIHNKVDARNVDVNDIHLRMTSNHIVEVINNIISHIDKFKDTSSTDSLVLRSVPRVIDREDIIEKYMKYASMIQELSNIIEEECDMHRDIEKIIEDYPSSFFSRSGDGIFGSLPQEHPIIKNMKKKVKEVYTMLSYTFDMYGKYMEGVYESARELPDAKEEFEKIFETEDKMNEYEHAWKSIDNNLKLALIQIKNLSNLSSNVRKILK